MTYGIYINSSMVLCAFHMIMAKLAGGKADPGDLISPEIFFFPLSKFFSSSLSLSRASLFSK